MAYGPDIVELYRQSGTIVGKALKAGKVAEIPIERPSRFVLALNMKTAKTLGLVFPHSLLLQADRVIE